MSSKKKNASRKNRREARPAPLQLSPAARELIRPAVGAMSSDVLPVEEAGEHIPWIDDAAYQAVSRIRFVRDVLDGLDDETSARYGGYEIQILTEQLDRVADLLERSVENEARKRAEDPEAAASRQIIRAASERMIDGGVR